MFGWRNEIFRSGEDKEKGSLECDGSSYGSRARGCGAAIKGLLNDGGWMLNDR